jgi:hypothetical protein
LPHKRVCVVEPKKVVAITGLFGIKKTGREHSVIFSFSIGVALFFSLFLLIAPLFHLFLQNRADTLVRSSGLDSVSAMIGLLGLCVVGALVGLHRRLAAVEKGTTSGQKS